MAGDREQSEGPEGEPGEREWPWLGTQTFWLIVAVALTASVVTVWRVFGHLARPDALVPVVSLSGPAEVVPGEDARYAVLVRDRRGAAIPHADVRVGFYKAGFLELGRGVTGPGGDSQVLVHVPLDMKEPRAIVAVGSAGVADGMDAMQVQPKSPGSPLVFISTDKPIYQPGQTIHLRALAMADERPLGDKPAVIEIRTWDNVKVFRAEKQTSAFGVVSADFALADQVKLGAYTLDVRVEVAPAQAGQSARTAQRQDQVEVKRYSLPKLKVAIEDVAPFAPDAAVRGTARATWIFGAPVTSGTFDVTLDQGGSPQRRARGVVDKNGVFAFVLPPTPQPGGRRQPSGAFTLRASLELDGGLRASATTTVRSLGGELKLEAFPESGALVPGVEQTVYVVVTDAQDVAGVRVRALPDGAPVRVSDRGFAALRVRPSKDDETLKLGAFGDEGSSGELAEPISRDALVVSVDRDEYGTGDTAHVTIKGGEAGDRIAVRMTKGAQPEGSGACLVATADEGCTVDLPVPNGVSGLLWIHALSLPKPQSRLRVGRRLVLAGSRARDLEVTATPDKAFWAPRQVGAIDVAVAGAGGAKVKAQLGASIADEAVFALADVRPDLEKAFFTVRKDLRDASGDGVYYYRPSGGNTPVRERPLPPSTAASDAYAAATPPAVRGAILAALTTMRDTGGFQDASLQTVRDRAEKAVARQHKRLVVFCALAVTGLALAGFAGFGLYGISRWRRPLLLAGPSVAAPNVITLRRETRGLFVDVLVALLAPPIVSLLSLVAADQFSRRSVYENVWFGGWLVLALFTAVLLGRGVLRFGHVAAARPATTLRRALSLLPVAIAAGHIAILLAVSDEGRRFEKVFADRSEAFWIPIVLALAAQLTVGLLSVIRQTQLQEITPRRRRWLLLSRATLLGLPVTLGFAGLLTFHLVDTFRRADWTEYLDQYDRDPDDDGYYDSSADQKEGGTGVRAKGEEGSMGNPNTRATGLRYGVQGPADNPSPVHVRDYFPETLLWAPDVVTDDQGHARIDVPFADSITTWRFNLSAVSQAGQLGSTTLPLVVKQDFFVDAQFPAVLTQGDEIAVPVTVFSYADGEQDVTLSLAGDGVSTATPSVALHLVKGDAKGTRFSIRADKAGPRAVHLRATSATHADAMDRTILVAPNGREVTRVMSGRATAAGASTVEFPANAIDGADDLSVKIYGGPLSQVIEGLDGVFRMPSGCFEQTSSTVYPSVLVLQFLRRAKATSPDVEKKAKDTLSQGYQRIVSFEAPGGGFSLFGGGKPEAPLTAYGLLELSEMAKVADVDPGLVDRAREWLLKERSKSGGWIVVPYGGDLQKEIARGTKDDAYLTAYVAWALAASSADPSKEARLAAVLDAIAAAPSPGEDAYDLTLRALALSAGGRKDAARGLLARLAKTAIRDDDGVHFASRAVGVLHSYGASLEEEVTGLATHALAVEGLEPELRSGALDWLTARRGAFGTWTTTQATIAAMRALLDEAHPVSTATQDVRVVVDGEPQEAYALEPRARDVHKLVGLRRYATTGKHTVEVRASGDGDVSYQLVATHFLPWQRGTGAALGLDVAYDPAAVEAGSTLTCHVRLSWKGKEPARMPLAVIGVPPAFEVETADLDALMKEAPDRSPRPVQSYTVEPGRVTLYFVSLAEDQPVTLDLRMRALWPASVTVPPSTAYLYYEPEVRTETATAHLRAL